MDWVFEHTGEGATSNPADLAIPELPQVLDFELGADLVWDASDARPLIFEEQPMTFPQSRLYSVKLGDTAPIPVAIQSNGSAVDLTTLDSMDVEIYASDGTTQKESVTLTTSNLLGAATNGRVQFTPTATYFDTAGAYGLRCNVTWTDTTTKAYPNKGLVWVSVESV